MAMPLDWDKLRIFHAAAEAGSFTHAADKLHLSQSAISRQVSALEQDVGVKLFHRHARGLILTEQGELLYRTAHDVLLKLETVKMQLTETTEKPSGKLRVTTTVGLGQGWLTDKVQEFLQLYPEMSIQLILDNEELDVNMRHADCAIRLRQPQQSLEQIALSVGYQDRSTFARLFKQLCGETPGAYRRRVLAP